MTTLERSHCHVTPLFPGFRRGSSQRRKPAHFRSSCHCRTKLHVEENIKTTTDMNHVMEKHHVKRSEDNKGYSTICAHTKSGPSCQGPGFRAAGQVKEGSPLTQDLPDTAARNCMSRKTNEDKNGYASCHGKHHVETCEDNNGYSTTCAHTKIGPSCQSRRCPSS